MGFKIAFLVFALAAVTNAPPPPDRLVFGRHVRDPPSNSRQKFTGFGDGFRGPGGGRYGFGGFGHHGGPGAHGGSGRPGGPRIDDSYGLGFGGLKIRPEFGDRDSSKPRFGGPGFGGARFRRPGHNGHGHNGGHGNRGPGFGSPKFEGPRVGGFKKPREPFSGLGFGDLLFH